MILYRLMGLLTPCIQLVSPYFIPFSDQVFHICYADSSCVLFFLVDLENQPRFLLKQWPDWASKIIKLAKVEAVTQPALKSCFKACRATMLNELKVYM